MPSYSFTLKSGAIVEVVLTIAEYSARVKDGAILLTRGELGEHWKGRKLKGERNFSADAGSIGVPPASGWPILSDACGVQPRQIARAREQAERLGVPTDFTRDGRAVLRDRAHRKKLLKALGMHDRRGGYGD